MGVQEGNFWLIVRLKRIRLIFDTKPKKNDINLQYLNAVM